MTPDQPRQAANPIGAQGNAWNAAAVGIAGTSNIVDITNQPLVTAFGHVSAATTITLQLSEDGTNFYSSQHNQVLAGAADFSFDGEVASKYARLISSAAATITATIAGKD